MGMSEPPNPFDEADRELIAELQTELKIAQGWAEVWERAAQILATNPPTEDSSFKSFDFAKALAISEFRKERGLSPL